MMNEERKSRWSLEAKFSCALALSQTHNLNHACHVPKRYHLHFTERERASKRSYTLRPRSRGVKSTPKGVKSIPHNCWPMCALTGISEHPSPLSRTLLVWLDVNVGMSSCSDSWGGSHGNSRKLFVLLRCCWTPRDLFRKEAPCADPYSPLWKDEQCQGHFWEQEN